jgi:hypothetical protein
MKINTDFFYFKNKLIIEFQLIKHKCCIVIMIVKIKIPYFYTENMA